MRGTEMQNAKGKMQNWGLSLRFGCRIVGRDDPGAPLSCHFAFVESTYFLVGATIFGKRKGVVARGRNCDDCNLHNV